MINLLPPENKEELIRERNWKLIVILGIMIVIFLSFFSLILFSIKIITVGNLEAQKTLLSQAQNELNNTKTKNLEDEINGLNKDLSQIDSFYENQFSFIDILGKISQILPSKTYLNNIFISTQAQGGKTLVTFNMSGLSATRDDLLELKNNLENNGAFTDIIIPPDVWLKAENISFTISFKLK